VTTPPMPPTQVMYATDVVNQYTTVGGTTRSHDGNGNLTDDGTYKFGYDFENRLVELRNSTTNALIASYRYDALGRRVEKALSGGATTRYVLDGVQVVEEFDGSNVWQARYVYEDGIDQPRCMDRADIADVNGNSNTTEVLRFHYHQQALGSVTELTQPTGAVVEWVTYDVYGLPTILNQVGTTVSQSSVGNPWLYTGREYDPESGTYFYRARTYDPGTGRFLQRDPSGYIDDLSLQQYASSSPTCLIDPLGLDPMPSDVVTKEDVENAARRAADSDGNIHRKPDVFKSPPTFRPPSVAPPAAPLPGVALGTPRPPLYPGPQPLAPWGPGPHGPFGGREGGGRSLPSVLTGPQGSPPVPPPIAPSPTTQGGGSSLGGIDLPDSMPIPGVTRNPYSPLGGRGGLNTPDYAVELIKLAGGKVNLLGTPSNPLTGPWTPKIVGFEFERGPLRIGAWYEPDEERGNVGVDFEVDFSLDTRHGHSMLSLVRRMRQC